MNYTDEQIKEAKKIGAFNATQDIWNKNGFWFQGIYITSPFLDKEGVKELSFDESVEYYGAENVNTFIRTALNI